MDISLIIALISLETCMCIVRICMQGRVSQNFELGLSFCFMVCRRRNFEKKIQKNYDLNNKSETCFIVIVISGTPSCVSYH